MEDSEDFTTILLSDMTASVGRLNDDNPADRRACVRAVFAAVEGHLATLCQDLLSKASRALTATECMALREENYRVDRAGKIVTIPSHQPLKQRVKFVTGIVKKIHPEYAIDFDGKGWQSLMLGLEVRHRITHPKNRKDMNVETSEVDAAINGVLWFLSQVIAPSHEGITAYLKTNLRSLTALGDDPYRYSLSVSLAELMGEVKDPPTGETEDSGCS